MTYGDGLSDVHVGNLVKFHKSHGRIATVTTVPPTSRFGMLDMAEGDRVGRMHFDCRRGHDA
jgi:glucose-1-phosphate cytidylyltransferase